jgi:hypothetical protein
MKAFQAILSCAALVALAALTGCISPVKTAQDNALTAADRRVLAQAVADGWSDTSALAARRLIEQYGAPDEVRSDRMVWRGNGPWRRTVVRDVRPPLIEGADLGVVEQTIVLPLAPGQAADVSAIDGRVTFDARTAELTARADREELNFLRLNLADDVADGRRTVEDARREYARNVSLEQSGRSMPDMHGLRFDYGP